VCLKLTFRPTITCTVVSTKYNAVFCLPVVSPDGVAPSQMVAVSASVNLPLQHKVQKFSSGTGSPGWSQKKGRKMVVCGRLFTSKFNISEVVIPLYKLVGL